MYGQKANASILATGITAASWWMWGMTVMLASVALLLLVRVFITLHSHDMSRRP